MITIDRNANTPVHEQLVEQLRYKIASGYFKVEEVLPSTRALAKQIGVSFHTVRKAYQVLEQEGLLQSRRGSGFTVVERVQRPKGERMEQGANVVQETLQRLIGLGLEESEVEYLFQEQLSLLESVPERHKLVFAAPYLEMAELCAHQLSQTLQQRIEAVTLKQIDRHQDADYVFTPYLHLNTCMEQVPRADVLGVLCYLSPEPLALIARLLGRETLGLITRYADAIPSLSAELRYLTGFAGQMIAASVDEGTRHLAPFIDQTDLVIYTPACRRSVRPLLGQDQHHAALLPRICPESLQEIRLSMPS